MKYKSKSKSAGKECFQRMNFLYQASHLMSNIAPGASTYYNNLLTSIGKKSQLRVAPEIKRTLCKSCRTLLIPDKTSTTKISKKLKCVIITCLKCTAVKRFPLKKGSTLWCHQEAATLEILDFTPNNNKETPKKIKATASNTAQCNVKSKIKNSDKTKNNC